MNRKKLQAALRVGLQRGLRGTLWMLKILVPCSLLTFVIDAGGLLTHLDFLLAPAMGLLSLPPEAALPLSAGVLAGIYGAVAAMAVLDLGQTETILVAVFLLISHNLIQESLVQARSGLNFFKATTIRLAASVVTVVVLAHLLPPGAGPATTSALPHTAVPFGVQLRGWVENTGVLCLQIWAIITAMMVVMELLRTLRAIPLMARALRPVLWLLGLSPRVGILWLTAAIFGLAYGAAVIVEETREGQFETDEIERLQLSIGINHALIEDPAIFMALGIPALWLWGPRLAAALVAVQLYRLWRGWGLRRRKGLPAAQAARSAGRSG